MALTWELPQEILLDDEKEARRINALRSLNLLEAETEDRFDRITRLAADFFQVPMAYVAFLDSDRQWFKSRVGEIPKETTRQLSLCQYTIHRNEPLVIPDTREHDLARTHPMVLGDPFLRFYAGIPLTGPDGQKIGTFCLLDLKPREFNDEQMARLMAFAAIVEREINLAEIIQTQHELLNARQEISQMQERMRHDIDDAVKYVRLMLPPPLRGPISIDWQFLPSVRLGGDGLGYRRINADQLAFYVLDVTGHGLGSALLAVTALEFLRSRAVRELDFSKPAQVVDRLNRTFQMKDHAGKFFSVWYGVYSRVTHQITYSSAGHPAAFLVTAQAGKETLTKTERGGPALGVFPEIEIPENTLDFPPGSQLCLFTDGLYEILDSQKNHGSYDELLHKMQSEVDSNEPLYESMLRWLEHAKEKNFLDDDVTLLRLLSRRK